MSNVWFQFKQFRIEQDGCAMKVSTDGVLLGAWAPMDAGLPLLDIGTGTGLVALIAAQRLSAAGVLVSRSGDKAVFAVELDPSAAAQAAANFAASAWSEHLGCCCGDVNDFYPNAKFGTILCNPPFFKDSLRCPQAGRNVARHADKLDFDTLASCVARLLDTDGLFSAIIPFDAVRDFVRAFSAHSLYLVRRTDVCTRAGKPAKRSLVTFSFQLQPCLSDSLAILDVDGSETSEYVGLVKDLYLKYM